MDIYSLLKKQPFLKNVDKSCIEIIAATSRIEKLPNSTYLASRGKKLSRLILITNGHLELSISNAEGKKHIVGQLATGLIFGLVPVLDGSECSHDAIADKNCEIITIPKATIHLLMEKNIKFNKKIIKILCRRARVNYETIASNCLDPISKRLAKALLDLFSQNKKQTIYITQSQISEILGVSRQSINKELKKIEKKGIIKTSRGQVILLSHSELTLLAQ